MLSKIAAAWPVSLNQTIDTADFALEFKDSSDAAFPLTVSYSLSINTGSYVEGPTGSSSGVICAIGDSAEMADGDSRESFLIELTCSPSKCFKNLPTT